MKHHLITILLLIAAAGLYVAGAALPATTLFIGGAVAETVFWVRLIRGRRSSIE